MQETPQNRGLEDSKPSKPKGSTPLIEIEIDTHDLERQYDSSGCDLHKVSSRLSMNT